MDYFKNPILTSLNSESTSEMFHVLDNPTMFTPYEIDHLKELIIFSVPETEIRITLRKDNIQVLFKPNENRYNFLTEFTRLHSIILLDNNCLGQGVSRYVITRKNVQYETTEQNKQ